MKNLLNDPDVMALYKSLQNGTFQDVDDYLTSNPVDFANLDFEMYTPEKKKQETKIFFDGMEVSDFIGDNDYGL